MTLALKESQVTLKSLLGIFSHELCGHRNPSYLFTRRKVISFFFWIFFYVFLVMGNQDLMEPGKKAKTAGVLMNLSRLRQLGPQQFTKKNNKDSQAFFNYLYEIITISACDFFQMLSRSIKKCRLHSGFIYSRGT